MTLTFDTHSTSLTHLATSNFETQGCNSFQKINNFQSGLQDQKSVKFSHSVISLNRILQNSKNTANIFLTLRNHVKIFLRLSEYYAKFLSAVYRKNLSIRTGRTDKTVKTLIKGPHCLSFSLLHSHIILQQKFKLFNFRVFSILISCVPVLRGFHL